MQDYHTGMRIHYSSGIPNRAFYLVCKEIGNDGYSWEKGGKIWYIALTDKLREYSNFQELEISRLILQDLFLGKVVKNKMLSIKPGKV